MKKTLLLAFAAWGVMSCSEQRPENLRDGGPYLPPPPVAGTGSWEIEYADQAFYSYDENFHSDANIAPPHGGHTTGWLRVLSGKRKPSVLRSAEIAGTPYVLELQKRRDDALGGDVCDYVLYNRQTCREELRQYSGVHGMPAAFYECSVGSRRDKSEAGTAVYLAPDKSGLVVDAFFHADHEEYPPFSISWESGSPRPDAAVCQPCPEEVVEEDWEMRGWSWSNVPVYGARM